ncbi:integron integrase [Isoalcanivorax pacificus W11-5]|uniref:Integron integrase n=1 Tax=Isoalcanivorax pacificus W11-5 TaxID=391936 RepID=A0A0B4XL40_9GAMM|nr:site-specific integrase [Isoalcanivorax pacificus]AJD47087.1 integron integrase [Isoalcanivorax pacificus W11-5]
MRKDIRRKPKLHGQFRNIIRAHHYNVRTEKTYWYWTRYFIRFHRMRHPSEITKPKISAFLTRLAAARCHSSYSMRLFFCIASSLPGHATALPNIPRTVSHAPTSIPTIINNSN